MGAWMDSWVAWFIATTLQPNKLEPFNAAVSILKGCAEAAILQVVRVVRLQAECCNLTFNSLMAP